MSPSKIILDTDPGVDDVLALLLALSCSPSELELLLVSLTFGNIDVRSCLRNAVSTFHVIERELAWRRERGLREGFEALKACKPVLAVGADRTLDERTLYADYFHGKDGLGDLHSTHPHLLPTQPYEALFDAASQAGLAELEEAAKHHSSFTASKRPAHLEMLRVLRENEPDTITIVAVGPLTNLALAAAEDPETFLRVKEVVVMGGAIETAGNMSPVGEFNTFADAYASARVFALTSSNPHTTMPPGPSSTPLPPYPRTLSRRLKLRLAPLDITHQHNIQRGQYKARAEEVLATGSPVGEFVSALLAHTFAKLESLHHDHEGDRAELSLHDPLCVWYVLTRGEGWEMVTRDVRVETRGQWTRGMCVVDRRSRRKTGSDEDDREDPDDVERWLGSSGNRVDVLVKSPGGDKLGPYMLDRIFGNM